MRKVLIVFLALLFVGSYFTGLAMALSTEDITKASALEEILKRGELRVGLEAGYQPFEMQDEKGNIVGFDVDMAYEMGKALFGKGGEKKVKLINTAWEGIIPALMTRKFDIIMSGMTVLQSRNLKVNFCEPYYYIGQCLLIVPADPQEGQGQIHALQRSQQERRDCHQQAGGHGCVYCRKGDAQCHPSTVQDRGGRGLAGGQRGSGCFYLR